MMTQENAASGLSFTDQENVETKKRFIQFVIKVSKLCNLRCKYCYEFPHLGEKARVSREQCAIIYRRAREFLAETNFTDGEVQFIWHGGEPLLLPCEFYYGTFDDQAKIINGAFPYKNIVQTNLTVLDEPRIDLLQNGFDRVGISVDLLGGLRVDIRGREQDQKVVANMERLADRGIKFGAITVLNATNAKHVEHIFDFFSEFRIPFRLLPLHAGLLEKQTDPFALSALQVLDCFQRTFEKWLKADESVYVDPIVDYVLTVAQFMTGKFHPRIFNKHDWINTLLIDTDGEVYSYPDPYEDKAWSYGNIFSSPLQALLKSEPFERSCSEADKRIAANCIDCRFFGACSGHPMAEGRNNEAEHHENGIVKCVVEKEFFSYLEGRLGELKSEYASGHGAKDSYGWNRVQQLLDGGSSADTALPLARG